MKKAVLLLLLCNVYVIAYNQVIKGTVFDQKTKETIGFASIYFNGTFVGTQSDKNGNFTLDISKNLSKPLTISFIGYNSVTLSDFSIDKPLLVYMTPKVYELKEVAISSKSKVKKRKANLELFKEVFLGTTDNANKCEIINEKDITFDYDSKTDTLKAFALKPIVINNWALGYKITYCLDKFEYNERNGAFLYLGNVVFNEDWITDEKSKEKYEISRKEAYLGSRMHFFRTLWQNSLNSSDYEVTDMNNNNLSYSDLVTRKISLHFGSDMSYSFYLKSFISLNIKYHGIISKLTFEKNLVYFDQSGYFDVAGTNWEGNMQIQRVGDMLPYEYEVKK